MTWNSIRTTYKRPIYFYSPSYTQHNDNMFRTKNHRSIQTSYGTLSVLVATSALFFYYRPWSRGTATLTPLPPHWIGLSKSATTNRVRIHPQHGASRPFVLERRHNGTCAHPVAFCSASSPAGLAADTISVPTSHKRTTMRLTQRRVCFSRRRGEPAMPHP